MAQQHTPAAVSGQLTKDQLEFLVLHHGTEAPVPGAEMVEVAFRPAYQADDKLFYVPADAYAKAIAQAEWDGTPRLSAFAASVLNQVPGQPLQAGAVGAPVGGAAGGDAPIVVKVYALGSGVAVPGQGADLCLAQGAFELEARGQRLVIDPLGARVTHRLVTPVQGDIAAVWQQVEAVDQEDLAKFGHGATHSGWTSKETAILSLPQGMGKTLFAHAIAARIGCAHVVDEWSPADALLAGALHLTSCEVA